MIFPEKLKLAALPTPIQPLKRSSESLGVNLFIKRDDMTGPETSGNKLRKLEYIAANAVKQGAAVLITCGAVQSNHCRATAAIAAGLGLKCHLLLSDYRVGDMTETKPDFIDYEGNFLADYLLGAKFTYIPDKLYADSRDEIMDEIKTKYDQAGLPAYVIPEGASNGLGVFGYLEAFYEILEQEKNLGLKFDVICVSTGSAGTLAGLHAGNKLSSSGKVTAGFFVSKKDETYKSRVTDLIDEAGIGPVDGEDLYTHAYHGIGYGRSSDEEIEFIKRFASTEGILLDPTYTGKGMFGLFSEIGKGNPLFKGNILFIHTGGHYAIFPKGGLF